MSRRMNKHNDKQEVKKKGGHAVRNFFLALLIIIVVFVLAIGVTYAVMKSQGRKNAVDSNLTTEDISAIDGADAENDGKTITYNGKTYILNENISTILFMGVDREEYNEEDSEYGNGGQADSLFLVAIDNNTGKMTMIPISRNSMVEVDTYAPDGGYGGQQKMQLTLAYAYGDGREKSCENVVKAVSRLMYGMPVNDYVAIDLSAIPELNDEIGGVTVEVLEDLTNNDPELVEGDTVTLMGDQAETYVRSRKSEGDDLAVDNNAVRMERQKQYVTAFIKQTLSQMKSQPTLPIDLYKTAKDNMITTMTASEVLYYSTLVKEKGLDTSIVSIPGEAKKGKYTEVYVDDDALYQIILNTFYDVQE